MKKKKSWITIIVILAVLVLAYFLMSKPAPTTDEEVAKCIGENSILYVQLGCGHCRTQEEMFGDNLKYLEIIDCFYERDKCEGIKATPTWKIKGELISGVQEISELQELTGC